MTNTDATERAGGVREAGSRSHQFVEGMRSAQKRAVAWLHERAASMKDPHAKAILDSAAFSYGQQAKLAALPPAAPAEGVTIQCDTCQGNGEIVADWERYMHAHDGDKGDEAVSECPDCNGTGEVSEPAPAEGVKVKALDLSNVLKHAFLSGVVAAREIAGHEECDGPALWTKYEPYVPGSYARILSTLTAAPAPAVVTEPVAEGEEAVAWIANDPEGGPYLTWSGEAAAQFPEPVALCACAHPPAAEARIAGLKAECNHWLAETRRVLKAGQDALDRAEAAEARLATMASALDALIIESGGVAIPNANLTICRDQAIATLASAREALLPVNGEGSL